MARPSRDVPVLPSGPESVIVQLTGLGLSRNEALGYVTLLEDDSGDGLTGYEVAARSGIPRSAVYSVLRKLELSGAAFSFGTEPTRFVPNAPAEWIEQLRRATTSRFDETIETLEKLPTRRQPEPVWILRRYEEVMARIDQMIRGARSSIYLSIWSRELIQVLPGLESIADRELHRVLHSPSPIDKAPAGFSCWVDPVQEQSGKASWSHKILVIVDQREALIGGTEPNADNQTLWTTNRSLVDVATSHIILDITLMARARHVDCDEVIAHMMRTHLRES